MAHARRYRWLVIAPVLLAGGHCASGAPGRRRSRYRPLRGHRWSTRLLNPPAAVPEQQAAARWVQPVDGACYKGYPVKANDNSGIYHLPGGRFCARTVPERCYAAAADAEADGYTVGPRPSHHATPIRASTRSTAHESDRRLRHVCQHRCVHAVVPGSVRSAQGRIPVRAARRAAGRTGRQGAAWPPTYCPTAAISVTD